MGFMAFLGIAVTYANRNCLAMALVEMCGPKKAANITLGGGDCDSNMGDSNKTTVNAHKPVW